MSEQDDEALLRKLDATAQQTLLCRWADRAVHEVGVGLLELVGDHAGRARLLALPPIASAESLRAATEAMFAVVERAAEGWQDSIDAAQAQVENWEQVLHSLGPAQVTLWSAFLVLLEDLASVGERSDEAGAVFEAALLVRNAAAALAELRAGGSRTAAISVAEAVASEEQRRQRREILELLPS